MRARLVSESGGPPVDLVKDLTLFGRDEDCDVRLDHKGVSKLHCVVVNSDGLLLLRDLGSTNGTRVNGQRIRRAALLPNDQLAIANLKFTVKFGIVLEDEIAGGPSVVASTDPPLPLPRISDSNIHANPGTPPT